MTVDFVYWNVFFLLNASIDRLGGSISAPGSLGATITPRRGSPSVKIEALTPVASLFSSPFQNPSCMSSVFRCNINGILTWSLKVFSDQDSSPLNRNCSKSIPSDHRSGTPIALSINIGAHIHNHRRFDWFSIPHRQVERASSH